MKYSLWSLVAGPWALAEEAKSAVLDVLMFRASGVELSKQDIAARLGSGGHSAVAPSQGAVAVIPIRGIISPDADEYFGGVTPDAIAGAFRTAMAADSVATIVLAIDSPGGSVYGVPEVADEIHDGAQKKRVVAVTTGMMASAAYYIGSAASEIISTPSGQTGSIGVYTMHADMSRMLQNAGIDVTVIKAGKYKAEGNPFGPLTDDARDAAQARIDDYYDAFVTAVARHRGVSTAAVRTGFGEGRVENARNAVKVGLVDRVASLDAVLGELAGKGASRSKIRAVADPPPNTAGTETLPIAASTGGDLVFRGVALNPSTQTAATGGAAAVVPLTPSVHAPAPTKAKENTVLESNTAALNGADAAASFDALMALADTHGKSIADVRQWTKDGKTVDQVRATLLDEYKAGSRPLRADPDVKVGADRAAEKPFASFGEQLRAIRAAEGNGAETDPRLLHINRVYGAASGGNTTVGSEGGFLVHPTFATEILRRTYENNALLSRANVKPVPAGSDRLTIPYIKETSRVTGSRMGGVQIYRRAEAATVTEKRPDLGEFTVKLEDLMGLAYLTGRAEEDAPGLGPIYEEAFGDEFAYTIQDEMVRGNGVARMQGIVGAPATVSVAKESGQLAATIKAKNIMKMWTRMWARSRANAVWFINQDIEPELQEMQIGTGASGQLVYMPPGGLSASPYGSIYGRPVIPIEQCSTLGTVGDIILADVSQYLVVNKGGMRTDSSIHVRFLYDENAFRFMMRINGAPIWQSALTPANGSNTLSPFITLATRA